jgi:hypothetical protein
MEGFFDLVAETSRGRSPRSFTGLAGTPWRAACMGDHIVAAATLEKRADIPWHASAGGTMTSTEPQVLKTWGGQFRARGDPPCQVWSPVEIGRTTDPFGKVIVKRYDSCRA